MDEIHKHPLKLYIQDIFRAKNIMELKYIYEIFGIKFKNIMIHGIVTGVYNKTFKTMNIDVSDATASIQVYFDCTKNKNYLDDTTISNLSNNISNVSKYNHGHSIVLTSMLDLISKKKENVLNFEEGDYVNIVGDIFVDEMRQIRMISAYECKKTSVERDLVWMEELRYVYEKFYLWNKITDSRKTPEIN